MEYKILHAQNLLSLKRSLEALTRDVMEAIALGWEPLGGIIVTDHGLVAQAMIKRR